MKLNLTTLCIAGAATALLAGCGSSVDLKKAPVETRPTSTTGSSSGSAGSTGNTASTAQSNVASVNLDQNAGMPTQRVLYFDFDSYVIKDEYKPTIDAYAKVLGTNKGKRVVVEGHTDERGGREYNLALGQKRAEAVVKSMVLLGATETQIEAVSFGEERAAAQGSDEGAWSKNRRAEVKDR